MRSILLLALATLAVGAHAQSLFTDVVARRPGDVLTVVLAERTAAQRQSDFDDTSAAALGGSAATGGSIAGQFGMDARYATDASAATRASQSDLLEGTVSVVVTGVDEAGNLTVEGARSIAVNGSGHTLTIAGIVRPADVRAGNVVYSYQIANAVVDYRQAGLRNKFFRPGFFTKAITVALIGAAVVFGASRIAGAAGDAPVADTIVD